LAVSFNLDGQALSFPDWATEATAAQMLEIMKKVAESSKVSKEELAKIDKANKELVKKIAEGNKEAEESRDAQEKHEKELIKLAKDQKKASEGSAKEIRETYQRQKKFEGSFLGSLKNAFESEGESVGVALMSTGETIFKAGAYASTVITGIFAAVGNTILGAGDSLNTLAKTGVGFNDTFADVTTSAGLGVSSLGGLTGSFESAAQLIAQNSNVVATQGFGRFRQTMQFAADISEDLGLSFEDSMQQFGDALSRRQSLLNLGNVDQARLNKQTATTVKSQMAYAKALGVSTEELENFVDSLIRDNGLLSASILGMSDTMRSDVVAGIEVFASGLAAMGGKAGQDVAAAFLEAGSTGAIGLSDAATGFVTALPSLAGPMEEFSAAMKSGTLSQAGAQDMVQGLTSQLGNLSAEEKARVKSLAIIGDENAKTLANAIAQFEQSEGKLKDINKALGTTFDMDAVQKGTNQFNKIMSQVSGGFSNAFYSMFANPEVMSVIEDGVKEIFAAFGMGVDDLSGAAMNSADMVKKFVPAIKSFVTFLVDGAKSIAEFFAQFKDGDEYDFGAMFDAVIGKATGLLMKAVRTFVFAWLGLTVAKHYAKQFLAPAIGKFSKQLFDQTGNYAKNVFTKYGPVAKDLGLKAMAYAQGMFSNVASASKNILNNSIAYGKSLFSGAADATKGITGTVQAYATQIFSGAKSLSSKIAGYASTYGSMIFSKSKDVASKVASMATGFMSKITQGGAPDVVGKMGQKAGGLLGGLKDKAAGLMPKGLKDKAQGMGSKVSNMLSGASDSADKTTSAMTKGGKSGGFLQSIANAVKKFGDNKVVKGAASLVLLGGAVALAAVGLKQFNEVDFLSIVKGGIALFGLSKLATMLGKGSTAMMKGAAAVAILGASVIPLAFGLNIMKGVGFETIGVLAGALFTLGVAGAVMGKLAANLLPGAVAIAALGASLIPLAFALNLMKDVGFETVEVLAGSLVSLGVAAVGIGFALPFILAGAVGIAALGAAMIPFALASVLFGKGMGPLSEGLQKIADVPMLEVVGSLLALGGTMTALIFAIPGMILSGIALAALGVALAPLGVFASMANEGLTGLSEKLAAMGDINWAGMMMAGPALLSLGAGMMALSAGGLISGLLDGLGKLFGSDSPFDKLAMIGQNSKYIVEMSKEMRNMDGTLSKFENSIDKIDADAIGDKFHSIAVAVRVLTSAIQDMGMGTILKLGMLNAMGVMPQAQAPAKQKSPAIGFGMNNVEEDPFDEMQGAKEIKKEAGVVTMRDGKPVKLSSEQQQQVQPARNMSQVMSGSVKLSDLQSQLVDPKAVPVVGQQNQTPQATTETTTTPAMPSMKSDTEMMEVDGISEKDLLQELIRLQTENNKLLKREMKAIEDNV